MSRYKNSSFILAAVISITVHATAVVYLEHYDSPLANQPQSTASVLQISLAPGKPAAAKPEPAPPPEPEAIPEPEPPPPPKEPAPEPVLKQEPLPEPVVEPLPESNEAPEEAEPIKEQTVASAYTEAPVDKPAPVRVALDDERESYLLQLLTHIDNHKFYPRSARRRGMEGKIQVSFYLSRDGSISNLQVTGGSKVLRMAAKQAVQKALSLPPPPESVQINEQIRFGMVYRLDG